MSDSVTSPGGDGSRSFHTPTGWKIVGERARELYTQTEQGDGAPGLSTSREDAVFATQLSVRGKGGAGSVLSVVLEELSRVVFPERPQDRLIPDEPRSLPITRYSGVEWDVHREEDRWTGELHWRHPHPVLPGAPLTSHVLIEERPESLRLSLRVCASDQDKRARSPAAAGQARPAFLDGLYGRLECTYQAASVRTRFLQAEEIADFVENILPSSIRASPIALIVPREEPAKGFVRDPEEVARTLMGVAHVWVIRRQEDTFRLSDALGDRRLSCFRGAFRLYLPGFSREDDPYDHPLLLEDRFADPVMWMTEVGRLSIRSGRALQMPPAIQERRSAPEPEAESDVSIATSPREAGPSTSKENGSREQGKVHAPPVERDLDPLEVVNALKELSRQVSDLVGEIRNLEVGRGGGLDSVLSEIRRLNTLTSLRSASTNALERRLGRLEELIRRYFEPAGDESEPAQPGELDEEEEEEGRLTLEEVVRAAGEKHGDHLLILGSAEAAAAESPYEHVEKVAVVLEAMAQVSARRQVGDLNASLREAFQDLGIDYRPGISESTPRRLRQQYEFADGETEYFCDEHINLGISRDPRYCLRIHFTSRVPAETRFVIGHLGRHFETVTT